MDTLLDRINAIKSIFEQQGQSWVEPYETTEGAINRKEVGDHRGLYYFIENNFYFGKAATNTVHNRHNTHRPKLDVNLARLYSTPVEKKEPRWIFPEGWKEGVRKFIIEDKGPIPSHWIKIGKKRVKPGVLDFPVTHKVDVDQMKVLVWNLDHMTSTEISDLEKQIIPQLWPYCNTETYNRRRREEKEKAKEEQMAT